MKHITGVYLIAMTVLVVTTALNLNKSENLNDILDELIKQTETENQNNHSKIFKSQKIEKPNNNSKIIYFKPNEAAQNVDPISNSSELLLRTSYEDNEVSKEDFEDIITHQIELEVERATEEDTTGEDLNDEIQVLTRSVQPQKHIDRHLSAELMLNVENTNEESAILGEIMLNNGIKNANYKNIIKNLITELELFEDEIPYRTSKNNDNNFEIESILGQFYKNYAIEEVIPDLDILKIDRTSTLEEFLRHYKSVNQPINFPEQMQDPANIFSSSLFMPGVIPSAPNVVRTVIHHPPSQSQGVMMYPSLSPILGNQLPIGHSCCRF